MYILLIFLIFPIFLFVFFWKIIRDNPNFEYLHEYNDLIAQSGYSNFTGLDTDDNVNENQNRVTCEPYRCKDENNCDCQKICHSRNTEKIVVRDEDYVIMDDVKLEPGWYCVPKMRKDLKCLRGVSKTIFSENGWQCLCLYPHIFNGVNCSNRVACVASFTEDEENLKNFILDTKTRKKINNYAAIDFYEKLEDNFRYSCSCKGKDIYGNLTKAVPFYPFACVSDVCLRITPKSTAPGLDFVNSKCNCGDFDLTRQKNLNGPQTPCTSCFSEYKSNILKHNVMCFNQFSSVGEILELPPCVSLSENINCGTFSLPIAVEKNDAKIPKLIQRVSGNAFKHKTDLPDFLESHRLEDVKSLQGNFWGFWI